ncbi:IS5 family transposase [Candidatus Aenigmatarchaeota archaeon]
MQIENTNSRKQRGLLIAQRSRIKKVSTGWRVPSQTKHIYYDVRRRALDGKLTCSCHDYQERLEKCKHIWAVELITNKTSDEIGSTITTRIIKPTYPQKWPAYDRAKINEKSLFMKLLHDLCKTVEEPQQIFGRPKMLLKDMIFASALKVYTTFSLRRFTSDVKKAKEDDFINKIPYYTTVARYMEKLELTPILIELIELSSLVLKNVETDFAVDSSGFSTSNFGRWFDYRFGKDQAKRVWIKAHLCVGVKTNIVAAVKLTTGHESDIKQFSGLVEKTSENFKIDEVSADKAYLSKNSLTLVQGLGGTAYIPFKSNSAPRAYKSRLWKKMWHQFMYNQEEFREHYHKRSNVETTFHMIKSKFGSHVRSRTETAIQNEILLKILCHNICVVVQEMEELGIKTEFDKNLNFESKRDNNDKI